MNTLRYAQRARFIQNNAVVNVDPHAAAVMALKAQVCVSCSLFARMQGRLT